MSALHGMADRNVIPRWRRFGKTVRMGELRPLQAPRENPLQTDDLDESLAAYSADPGIHTAGDALSHAVVLGVRNGQVESAARFIAEDRSQDGRLVSRLAHQVLANSLSAGTQIDSGPLIETGDFRHRIRLMRAIVQREPRNSIRWADLALGYVNLGQMAQAERAMKVAVNLAPTNRYVLRSAVRLYLLLNEPDKARFLLRDDDLLRDPWIHASDLSLAEITGQSPRKLRAARSVLDEGRFAPWHLTELASEIATIDLRAGRVRQGKKLLRQALVSPTENTLAQVQWASIQNGLELQVVPPMEPPLVHEAKARAHEQEGNYAAALEEAIEWQVDQPFDPEPALFGSYVAAMALERYDTAINIAERGLRSNPTDTMLRNNLVFALASVGRIEEAEREASKMGPLSDVNDAAVVDATRGLVSFRRGDIARGREKYGAAVNTFRRNDDRRRATLASYMWAREEVLAGTPEALRMVRDAVQAGEGEEWRVVDMWRRRLMDMVDAGDPRGQRRRSPRRKR